MTRLDEKTNENNKLSCLNDKNSYSRFKYHYHVGNKDKQKNINSIHSQNIIKKSENLNKISKPVSIIIFTRHNSKIEGSARFCNVFYHVVIILNRQLLLCFITSSKYLF